MKQIMYALDAPPKDATSERLDKEPIINKYWFNLGLAIIFLMLTCLVFLFIIIKRSEPVTPYTMAVNLKNNKGIPIVTLPFAHQSFQNVSGWVFDAIIASHSFNFTNYYEQVDKASYYFTPQGYSMYLKALDSSKIEGDILKKRLDISIVPLQQPILINGGVFAKTEFWRFGVPVLVSYYGGKSAVVQKQIVEVLVLRVPSYMNPRGLAISEFNMTPL